MSEACDITLEDLLSAQYIAKNLKLSNNKKTNILAANNLTRTYGRGMEYSHSRIYQPGDDVRHIDWRLTARQAKTYTKLHHEEKGENNYIILDLSQSMHFGTKFALKSVIASRAAAILAWLGYNENNSIGSIVFNDQSITYTPSKLTKNNLILFFNNIVKQHEQYDTASKAHHHTLLSALTSYEHCIPRNSRVFIISDFCNINDLIYKKIEKLNYENLVYLIKISDPIESNLLPIGRYNITNGNQSTLINIDKHNQEVFIKYFQEKLEVYYKIIKKLNIKHLELLAEPKWYYKLLLL